MKTGGWTREKIEHGLMTDARYVENALVAIFKRQTSDERDADHTRHHNLRGFTPYDARYYSRLAKRVIFLRNRNTPPGQCLTPGMLVALRRPGKKNPKPRICKYAAQLLKVIEERLAAGGSVPPPGRN